MSFRKWFRTSGLSVRQRFHRIFFVLLIGLVGLCGATVAIMQDIAGEDRQAQACLVVMFLSALAVCICAVFAGVCVALEHWSTKLIARVQERSKPTERE